MADILYRPGQDKQATAAYLDAAKAAIAAVAMRERHQGVLPL